MARTILLSLVTFLLGAAACGGPKSGGKIPVTSPVYEFQKPDAEDLVPEDEEAEDDAAADADADDAADGE